jgi:hypothetical protein
MIYNKRGSAMGNERRAADALQQFRALIKEEK